MNTAQARNKELQVGDFVFSRPTDEYGCLVGKVTGITPLGSPEHDTGNASDDIHVDFFIPYSVRYSDKRKNEIAEEFSWMYGEPKTYDELPLDDVIMSPESLVRITGSDIFEHNSMLSSREEAETYYDSYINENHDKLHAQLMDRIDKNLSDYQESLMGFGTRELIDMAGKISAMSDAHTYMSGWRGFGVDELEFYLRFQNPLEVLADEWHERNTDLQEMSFTMDDINESRDSILSEYPLMRDADPFPDKTLRRFMGVDLIDFLGKISEKVILHYPNDWNIDKDSLFRIAASHDTNEKRLIWHVCAFGTHMKQERDVFIKDTGAFEYMTDYRQNDPDMFGYVIEVTGKDGQIITGNVFEVGNYAEYAKHIRDTAEPLESLTLFYSGEWGGVNSGKAVTVSRKEYDDDRHRLMCESGRVTELVYHPKDKVRLAALLTAERSRRMAYPLGSQQEHLRKLDEKLSEIRKPPEQARPPAAKKLSITAQLEKAGDEAKAYNAQRAQNKPQPTKNNKKEID